MKKKIKVFEVGKYPQGDFSKEKIQKIFGDVQGKVETIFSHTSKWIKEEKNPVVVGEFSNFEIVGESVYGEVEFNETGAKYYKDGILKGVSVEIDKTDTLKKVAVLPVGINPAVSGAEFEEQGYGIEFQDVSQLNIENLKSELLNLKNDVLTLNQADLDYIKQLMWDISDKFFLIKQLKEMGYTVTKEFSKEELEVEAKKLGFEIKEFQVEKQLTQEEIRTQVKAELEFEVRRDTLKNDIKSKFRPNQHEIIEFAIDKAFENRETLIEFSGNEKGSMFEKIEKAISKLPKDQVFTNHYEKIEFQKENTEDSMSYFNKAKEETLKMYGGK